MPRARESPDWPESETWALQQVVSYLRYTGHDANSRKGAALTRSRSATSLGKRPCNIAQECSELRPYHPPRLFRSLVVRPIVSSHAQDKDLRAGPHGQGVKRRRPPSRLRGRLSIYSSIAAAVSRKGASVVQLEPTTAFLRFPLFSPDNANFEAGVEKLTA